MIYPLAPKPKQKPKTAAAEEGFLPEEVDSWEAEGVSPEELDRMSAPQAKPAPKDSFEANDYNYFTNQTGERQRRKMDWQDRTTGAVLGMLEAPLFGANDEVVGAASAGLEQAQAELAHRIKTMVGVSARVRVAPPGSIERSMGKAKRVVDLRFRG
jgi:hypothetical protein